MTQLLTPRVLRPASYVHSTVYAVLLWAAITDREDLVSVLGWVHGIGWIVMSIACLVAARVGVIPIKVAVAVVVLGGIGPFFGSIMFIREQQSREWVG